MSYVSNVEYDLFEVNQEVGFIEDQDIWRETEDSYELEDFEALGIIPTDPTSAKPGSEEKVLMLAARYAAGLPLWNKGDCYDHSLTAFDLSFADLEDEEEL